MKKHVIRGSAWTFGGFVVAQALRFGGNIIMARLLAPDAFGLMATVMVVMEAMVMLSEVGTASAVIQHRRGSEPRFLNTAWTIQILRGFAMFAGACALAWPIARLNGRPELAPMIVVTAGGLLISGFASMSAVTFRRELRIGRLTAIELARQVVGLIVMLLWALFVARSAWAFVVGGVAGYVVSVVLGYALAPNLKHGLAWDREAVRDMWKFGRWIFWSTVLTLVSLHADRFILGPLKGMELLGVYNIAVMFAMVVPRFASELTRKVLYPSMSRVNRVSPERMRSAYYRARFVLDAATQPVNGFFLVGGTALVQIVYTPDFWAAGPFLQILAIRAAMMAVITPMENCLFSSGRTYYGFVRNLLRTITVLIGLPVGYHFYGLTGFVWAVGLSETLSLVVLFWGMRKHGLLDPLREGWTLVFLGVGALMGAGAVGIHALLT